MARITVFLDRLVQVGPRFASAHGPPPCARSACFRPAGGLEAWAQGIDQGHMERRQQRVRGGVRRGSICAQRGPVASDRGSPGCCGGQVGLGLLDDRFGADLPVGELQACTCTIVSGQSSTAETQRSPCQLKRQAGSPWRAPGRVRAAADAGQEAGRPHQWVDVGPLGGPIAIRVLFVPMFCMTARRALSQVYALSSRSASGHTDRPGCTGSSCHWPRRFAPRCTPVPPRRSTTCASRGRSHRWCPRNGPPTG